MALDSFIVVVIMTSNEEHEDIEGIFCLLLWNYDGQPRNWKCSIARCPKLATIPLIDPRLAAGKYIKQIFKIHNLYEQII